jgi:imidazolonepropionase-like amidohydrolase
MRWSLASGSSLLALAACASNASVDPPKPPIAPPAVAEGAMAAPPPPDRTLRYSFLLMDHKAGGSVLSRNPDGSRDVTFEFNDRGRGPKQATHYEVARDGTLSRLDTTGVDYLKQPVEEHLTSAGGAISWKNDAEQGSAPSSAPAAYVAQQGPPELLAALVRAILAAPRQEIALLPAGKASLTKAGDRAIEANGQRLHVTRYDVEGLDYEPQPVWLDDDHELFARADGWSSVIREGWEPAAAELVKSQRDAQAARLGALSRKHAHRPPEAGLAIVHARLFDVETKKVVPDATVVIKADRIVAAGPGARIKAPAGAETIDAGGKTVIPGLWDMHEHVTPMDGLHYIAGGVTGARDLGNDMEQVLRTKRAWDAGEEIGPRLVLAGFIDGRGPFQAPTKVFADTREEGNSDIDLYARQGYEQIKLYSSLKPELVAPLAAHAHDKGLRVSGHVPTGMNALEAVKAGYDELQHANFLFLHFLATKEDDTRTPLRFTRVAQKAASLDLSSPEVRDFVKALADHKTVVDPTLAVFEGMFTARRGQIDPGYAAIADRLPAQVRRGLLNGGLPVPEGMDATYRASFAAMQKLVKMLWDAGVRVVPGTDGGAGFALHLELELYEQAGIPAADVIALATIGAARVVRHDKEWGSIAKGKLADLVIVDGQPDVHVRDVRKPVVVVKGGVVYRSADLYRALGVGT